MYGSRRVAPLVLIVIITILVIAILVAVGRALLHRPSATEEVVDTTRQSLLSTDEGHKVQMTVRGPIVANEEFRSYQITITPSSRQFVAYTGYLDKVTKEKKYGNNVPAYEELVYALDRINMLNGVEAEGEANDVRGICSSGQLYEFAILEGDTTVKKLWTTSCKKSKGTLKANPQQVGGLIVKQVPDGYDLIKQARAKGKSASLI